MPNDYENQIRDLTAAANVPDMAGELIRGGVAPKTVASAIRGAQAAGATDMRQAIRAHNGVAAQLAYTGSGAATSPDDWTAAFERAAPAASASSGEQPAASHQDSWQTAFERAR